MAAPHPRSIDNAWDTERDRAIRTEAGTAMPPTPMGLDYELHQLSDVLDVLSTEVDSLCSMLAPISHPGKEEGPVPNAALEPLPFTLEYVRSMRLRATYLQGLLMSARHRLAL